MAMDNIEKLRDKVAKDPDSKLFVPLAEEYRKTGLLDNAVSILKVGLERQPNYMSARVALGKIYFEKNMMSEAKAEFEKVIKAIPDNLFAQRKLADIYRHLGDKENAIARYKSVLKLNPIDEEVAGFLRELETPLEPELAKEPELPMVKEILPEEELKVEEAPETEWLAGEEITEEIKTEEAAEPFRMPEEELKVEEALAPEWLPGEAEEEDVPTFGLAMFESLEAETANEDGLTEEAPIEGMGLMEEELLKETEEMSQEEDVLEKIALPEVKAEMAEKEETKEEIIEEAFFEPTKANIEEPLQTEESLPFEDIEKGQEISWQAASIEMPEEEPSYKKAEADIKKADAFIEKGSYYNAMQAYKAVLKNDPEDRRVLQRVHELRTLLKMLGKDKEVLIARLDSFLGAIKRRRDEFFRSP